MAAPGVVGKDGGPEAGMADTNATDIAVDAKGSTAEWGSGRGRMAGADVGRVSASGGRAFGRGGWCGEGGG